MKEVKMIINRNIPFKDEKITRCIFCGGKNIMWDPIPKKGDWDENPLKWIFFDYECQNCSCVMQEVWIFKKVGTIGTSEISPPSYSWEISQERMRIYYEIKDNDYMEYSFWGVLVEDIPIPWGRRSMPCLYCGLPLLSWNYMNSLEPINDSDETCVAFIYNCPHCHTTMAKLWGYEKTECLPRPHKRGRWDPKWWRISREGNLHIWKSSKMCKTYSIRGMRVIPSLKGV